METADIRIGHGYDIHQLADGLPLVLGGVKFNYARGCVAHSDGDVIVHALCDALLGSLALGDIGYYFPDTSSEFKNIDSMILLSRVVELVQKQGYSIGNADISLVLQRPKIADKILLMRQALSSVMNISFERVSVKATTAENLGFVGKEEGVEAFANVLVYKV